MGYVCDYTIDKYLVAFIFLFREAGIRLISIPDNAMYDSVKILVLINCII